MVLMFLFLAGCGNVEDFTRGGCRDGRDNDGDGRFDCADPDCADRWFCGFDTGRFDTGRDTGEPAVYMGPWQIATVSWDCTVGSGAYTYEFVTDGWADDMGLEIFESAATNDPREERHSAANVDFAEDGSWDRWAITLDYVTSPDSVVSGESTSFVCGTDDATRLAWMAWMSRNGSRVDCGIWGTGHIQHFNNDLGHDCYDFEP